MKAPFSICSFSACRSIATKNSRCKKHQREQTKEISRSSTTSNNNIYNSSKWRNLRTRKAHLNPLCEECLTYNVIRPLDVIDHIQEIEDYPELAYTYSNLKSLCHSCHNNKTAKAKTARTKTVTASDMFKQIQGRK
ncbi:HNH endonuclease signature motif containing protein [Psychromonas aquimarina]|uniref:HNH endonuclease signature motif containing protein n=1 Tax=Psychromonas aquimarina TaxID=444919 RepID=UPI000687B7E3